MLQKNYKHSVRYSRRLAKDVLQKAYKLSRMTKNIVKENV